MKDYLGHELREGDHVVTIVNINRGSGGTAFVTATIDCLTRTRVYLRDWQCSERCFKKQYTMPEKCIRVLPK